VIYKTIRFDPTLAIFNVDNRILDSLMSNPPPAPLTPDALAVFTALYAAANDVWRAAPWTFLNETQLFGVQDPNSDQIGFVSIMGALGEHFALDVYLDEEGLFGFIKLQESEPLNIRESIFEIPQIQLSFERKALLFKEEKNLFKALGLTYKGNEPWPSARSIRPGCYPWIVDPDEAVFLTHCLRQTINVTARAQHEPELLPELTSPPTVRVRVPERCDGALKWKDEVQSFTHPESMPAVVTVPFAALAALSALKPARQIIEADFFMAPMGIGKEHDRRMCAYILLIADRKSGTILAHDVMTAQPSLEQMRQNAASLLMNKLAELKLRPSEIRVRSPWLHQGLKSAAQTLRFALSVSPQLPMVDMARDGMLQQFMGEAPEDTPE